MQYSTSATDQYMRDVIQDEFSADEADNALTALTVLTSVSPRLFPFDRTFVRTDHQRDGTGASGVRFIVFGDTGVDRMVRIPREDLDSVITATDTVISMAFSIDERYV